MLDLAVRTRCWTWWVGGWVGGWERKKTDLAGLVLGASFGVVPTVVGEVIPSSIVSSSSSSSSSSSATAAFATYMGG